MTGLKTIRTSNWDGMVEFYGNVLGMRECDGESPNEFRHYRDYKTEIFLERIDSPEDHELVGRLALYSEDPKALAGHFRKKAAKFTERTVSGSAELVFHDPDGNVVTISQAPDGQ